MPFRNKKKKKLGEIEKQQPRRNSYSSNSSSKSFSSIGRGIIQTSLSLRSIGRDDLSPLCSNLPYIGMSTSTSPNSQSSGLDQPCFLDECKARTKEEDHDLAAAADELNQSFMSLAYATNQAKSDQLLPKNETTKIEEDVDDDNPSSMTEKKKSIINGLWKNIIFYTK